MPSSFMKVLSIIISIIAVLPQVPGAFSDYIKSAASQNTIQAQRLEAMRSGKVTVVDEQSFANFDLNDNSVKYNEVRMLTTHNSYKKSVPVSLYALSSKVFGPKTLKSNMYEHDTPVKQLENGVRGLELDIRWQFNGFKIFHQHLPDNLSNSPDWKMTLEELRLWSQANPSHVPITVLVEIKYDDPELNPLYRKMDEEKFRQLDDTIKTIMGKEQVITASGLMGNYPSLGAMVENNGWPALSAMKGKFIFLLHPDSEYTDMYINRDRTLKTQMFVPVISNGDIEKYPDYAAFVLSNDPNDTSIKGLVNRHYVVRTMMDSGLYYDENRKAAALACGAQMLTTDLEKGVIMPKTDYTAYISGKYTIVRANENNS